MATNRPLVIGIVAGEESGDLLAADLVRSLQAMSGRELKLVGVGGPHLEALGLRSSFDPAEISLMGFGAVVSGLPRILRRISQAAWIIAAAEPDCLVTVDVPDFSLRVAAKTRARRPHLPTVHYVCPSVWAWRPGRAKAMRRYLDHVLCVLPFEPAELARLGGPAGTYVGHRLTHEPGILAAAAAQQDRVRAMDGKRMILLLPGSRGSEVKRLLPDFRAALGDLRDRGNRMRVVLPTVPRLLERVRTEVAQWQFGVEVTADPAEKWKAFGEADAALIASGTVSLELALAGVPHLSCYRLDAISRPFKWLIQSWSGSLPNLIADRPAVPEFYDDLIRSANLARQLEALAGETELRRWQLANFERVREAMNVAKPAGLAAAEIVLSLIQPKR